MPRRREKPVEDLLRIATVLPWWVNLVLAGASYVGLGLIAVPERTAPAELADIGSIGPQLIYTFAQIGKIALPVIFVIGAAFSIFRRRKAGRLVTEYARPGESGRMHWRDFELMVEEVFRRRGYAVHPTPSGADGGVDLVAARDDERLLIQCKHWNARQVGVKVVRELVGVMSAEGVQGGVVVTSGTFTLDAKRFAMQAGVELIDGAALGKLAAKLDKPEPAVERQTSHEPGQTLSSTPDCPDCGLAMVSRTARRGRNAGKQFWGCSDYPSCKGIVAK